MAEDQAKITNKIEDYLLQGGMPYEKIEENMWAIHDEFDNIENIVVHYTEPLVIFRVKLMEIPKNHREEFFEKLLCMNASNLVHGAYAIEAGNIIIVDTLEAENLDYNEFQASLDAIVMAISNDFKELQKYVK